MPVEANLTGTEKWTFDQEVADAFDDMLARSIPDYDGMRELTADLAGEFMDRGRDLTPRVLDLGTSRGEVLETLWYRYGPAARYVGLDVSEPMLAAARDRFANRREWVRVEYCDIRHDWPEGSFDVTLSVLTLQFTPIEYRPHIIQKVYDSLKPGGAFLMVEKVLGESARLDRTFVDLYYRGKARAGYSVEEINRKRAALEGVLVPVSSRWNVELLQAAGFRSVDRYWRRLNFEGYLALKD